MRSTGGVGMVAANRLRHGWRGVVALAVVVGVVGAIVLGVVAGARRTDTALERFRESSGAADLQITTREPTEAQLEELRSLPEVAAVAELPNYQILVDGSQLPVVPAAVDETFGTDIDRAVVLEGREADPDAIDEVTIGEGFADQLGIGVGDRLEAISVTPEQVEVVIAGDFFDGAPGGPPLSIEVVGIVRRPLDLGELGGTEGLFVLPPGFHREYRDQIGVYQTILRVRTAGGAAEHAFKHLAERIVERVHARLWCLGTRRACAALPHHLADAGKIARAERHAAGRAGVAHTIDRDGHGATNAKRLPQALPHQVADALPPTHVR